MDIKCVVNVGAVQLAERSVVQIDWVETKNGERYLGIILGAKVTKESMRGKRTMASRMVNDVRKGQYTGINMPLTENTAVALRDLLIKALPRHKYPPVRNVRCKRAKSIA